MGITLHTFTVSFFGHRYLEYPLTIEKRLEPIIADFLRKDEYVEFLVGRDGDFDQIVSSVVRRCKRAIREDNSALVWVLPYLKAEYANQEDNFHAYYDEVEICEKSSGEHYKAAYQIRNQCMIDRSDLVIFCVEKKTGGASQAMRYAVKQGKSILNLGVSE